MNKGQIYGLLAAIVVCGCSEKKDTVDPLPVKVKMMQVVTELSQTGQSYAGTIEEMNGTALSFSGIGTIKQLFVHEGQMVRAGQHIGELDATSATNAHAMALATKEQAEDALERMTMLHDAGALPEVKWVEVQTQVRQARAQEQIARKGLTDTRLVAPFSGYISEKSGEVGQNVAPGVPVARLVKIDQVKVRTSIPEDEISSVNIGQQVQLHVYSLGDGLFTGRITEKGVSGDRLSRSYEVCAVIDNPRHELLPGMVCDVYTRQAEAQPAIALAANLVQVDADNVPFVWTVSHGKAHKTTLTLGENVGEKVIIANGLNTGDSIIVSGQQKVSSGMRVRSEE